MIQLVRWDFGSNFFELLRPAFNNRLAINRNLRFDIVLADVVTVANALADNTRDLRVSHTSTIVLQRVCVLKPHLADEFV